MVRAKIGLLSCDVSMRLHAYQCTYDYKHTVNMVITRMTHNGNQPVLHVSMSDVTELRRLMVSLPFPRTDYSLTPQ